MNDMLFIKRLQLVSFITRMHSSRMHTSCSVTISGGGCIPEEILGGEKLEKNLNLKKIWNLKKI